MNKTAEKALPLQVGALGNLEARMLRNFRAAIDDWDEVCTALGAWEAEHLTDDNSHAAKEQHRGWINELLLWGKLVQEAIEQPAVSGQSAGRKGAEPHPAFGGQTFSLARRAVAR